MKIKFFITPVYPYGNDHYYHEMIALAEGFHELGHEVFGNCNYWWVPETKSFLIKEDLANTDFDLAIYDYRYVTSFAHLLFRKGYPNFDRKKIHVLVDRNDWLQPIWWKNDHYKIFDLIFAGNLYSNLHYAENIKPWAIGLTNRIIKAIDAFYKPGQKRNAVTGYNFRVDHNMRGYLAGKLKEKLIMYPATEAFTTAGNLDETSSIYNKNSSGRHNPDYYKILCETQFFMAFGGYFEYKPIRFLPYTFTDKIIRKPNYWKYKRLAGTGKDFSDTVFVFQHDSFRFWEVLYSGSIALNLDFDFWNFKLPVMPVANKHYIGIKQLSANGVEENMKHFSETELGKISQEARAWATDNYSPKAQAQRILGHVSQRKSK